MDRVGIDQHHLVADKGFRRQQQGFGDKRGIQSIVGQGIAHGINHRRMVGALL